MFVTYVTTLMELKGKCKIIDCRMLYIHLNSLLLQQYLVVFIKL
jgi:hypothetical protein